MAQGLKRVALYTLLGFLALVALVVVAMVVVGFFVARLSAQGAEVDVERIAFWISTGVAVVSMSGAMAITIGWMRAIDEAAREAHKSAWFWGGCGGMAVGGVLVILASTPHAAALQLPSWFGERTDPAAYMATGAAILALLMVAGYTLAWAWWWWRRR
ncbi:hypothetical protein [Brevundimonas sp.]|uniref:hypothetical protein n=1 Tax=Brevundimonas sp. TaxID=1871086 RepID=UPI0035B0CBDD